MLPKKNRAGKYEVDKIWKEGRFLNSPIFTLKYAPTQASAVKISVIVPKNIAKLATKRNYLRRKAYLALGKCLKDIPKGTIGALVFKKNEANIQILEDEIKGLVSKIN